MVFSRMTEVKGLNVRFLIVDRDFTLTFHPFCGADHRERLLFMGLTDHKGFRMCNSTLKGLKRKN